MRINPLLLADFYKVGHVFQYPKGTTKVYSNFTPRRSRMEGVNKVVFFGLQYFLKEYLQRIFSENFFCLSEELAVKSYSRIVKNSLGVDLPTYDHIRQLYRCGYLPLSIKALPEGTLVPIGVPCLTVTNTKPEFYWLPNFIETMLSSCLWQACTSATIAHQYKKLLDGHAELTGIPKEFVQWQGHDFSFRGMGSPESALLSGMGHLLSFSGTDTIPAIVALEEYYCADVTKELVGGSVPATEHSVMSCGGDFNELETYRRLITEVYPNGIVSIVSDTWNLWKVCTDYMRTLKNEVLNRNGKVVIRPDSGNPVDILCGDSGSSNPNINAGVVQLLWDVFGGTYTRSGFRLLDSHIGVIYGDAITLDRADKICKGLEEKGFASQCVLGIGSYTYQYNTRDTFGFAMKATYAEVNGESKTLFKDPVTDSGEKKSARGLLCVKRDDCGRLVLIDNVTPELEKTGELVEVFNDGVITNETSLFEIRNILKGS